jgi:hypothetical protein
MLGVEIVSRYCLMISMHTDSLQGDALIIRKYDPSPILTKRLTIFLTCSKTIIAKLEVRQRGWKIPCGP